MRIMRPVFFAVLVIVLAAASGPMASATPNDDNCGTACAGGNFSVQSDPDGRGATGTISKPGRSSSTPAGQHHAPPRPPTATSAGIPRADRTPSPAREQAIYRAQQARWLAAVRACRAAVALQGAAAPTTDCKAQAGPRPKRPLHDSLTDIGSAPADSRVDVQVLARQAVARLRLPAVTPKIGPPPQINPWGIAVVGYPLWLWTTGPDTHTTSVTLDGITLTLTARRTGVRFDMGAPGARPVVCTDTTPWTSAVEPAAASPTCGYTYRHASITRATPHGVYTVTATERWTVTWSALGRTGALPLQVSGAVRLPVGEVQTVRRP